MPKDHYVPQFYLRRFANSKGQLRVYRRSTQQWLPKNVNVKNVAAETDFYTIITEVGVSREVETFLSKQEGNVQSILAKQSLLEGEISRSDRYNLAFFIALQHVRTSAAREMMNETWDSSSRMIAELNIRYASDLQLRNQLSKILNRDPSAQEIEGYRNFADEIAEIRIKPSNNNFHVRMMLDIARDTAPGLAARPWRIFRFEDRLLVTSDSPVMLQNETQYTGGLLYSDSVIFPMDSRTCLYIDALDLGDPMTLRVLRGGADHARNVNRWTALSSHEWIFADERIKHPLKGISIPREKVTSIVNGMPVHQGESSWNVLRKQWLTGMDAY